MTEKEMIEAMAHKNGRMKIICKLKEELAELLLAFERYDYAAVANENNDDIIENIHEEFVDVEILMIQFRTLLEQGIYEQKKEEKIEHIKQLLYADV